MDTTMLTSAHNKTGANIQLGKALLICGILSPLLYVAMNIFVPMKYPGYSATAQTISELSAIDAPTRSLWIWPGLIYSLLMAAFGMGTLMSAADSSSLRSVGILMLAYGIVGLCSPLVPMHKREVLAAGGANYSDTLHIIFVVVTIMLMLMTMSYGAVAFGTSFRWYSIMTMVFLVLLGIPAGMDAPRLQSNHPTRWLGIWERSMIGVFLLWVMVLATLLLKWQDKQNTVKSNQAEATLPHH